MIAESSTVHRAVLVRRGLWLSYITIGYNSIEAGASIFIGLTSGSVGLLGFGVDSAIEVTSSAAAQWRLRSDRDATHRDRVEQLSLRIIGWCFLGLAAYVAFDSVKSLWLGERPERSVPGIAILALSVVIMPILARAKRRQARAMNSGALTADARQTSLCAYLSAIALVGVALNVLVGWWWADPAAALLMVPIIAKEGVEGLRGGMACDDCAT
ncbi:MAG: cation transporter [Gemmatimonadota bacterium]|nr:cation transporter [Gemmatimonadota bacterium]